MIEKIEVRGTVVAFPDAFDLTSKSIMVVTAEGMINIPVSDPRKYKINQKVKISLTVEKCGNGV